MLPLLEKLRALLRPKGDVNLKRIQRRRAITNLITRRLTSLKIVLFLSGYLWMIAIPSPRLGRGTYMDENAVQPAQVNTNWNWGDVHTADLYLAQLENLRDSNATSEQRATFLKEEFSRLGLTSGTQKYTFSTTLGEVAGENAYALISSPRTSGTEAMVISASWLSRSGEGDGTLNLRGVATILALANFLKGYSYWARDIVFVISDDYLVGMQAWLATYHGSTQRGLKAESLEISSGVIWTALNIDYPGHSFSHLGIFHEGLNGRLPNQDLVNSCVRIARWTAGVPVTIYDHLDPREEPTAQVVPSWVPPSLYKISEFQAYLYQGKNFLRHLRYQANGRGSGVHGLFHQFRIDAITLFAVPATGPHGFHAIGRTVESSLRSMNNLLERLHASFFFYILTGPEYFSKIGHYLPSAILISVAMMFHGLSTWVNAAWSQGSSGCGKGISETTWKPSKRPVLSSLSIMLGTHLLGAILFALITQSWFAASFKVLAPILFLTFAATPLLALAVPGPPTEGVASVSQILKAFNLCCASTVISIVSVLNFSLAACLAMLLGIPLSLSSPSRSISIRLAKYICYAVLGLGWLVFAPNELLQVIWSWEVLGVWLAPFVCIVYVPLVLQAGISCLIVL